MEQITEAEANLLRAKLHPFLSQNPEADVRSGDPEPAVIRPWGEESIRLLLSENQDELIAALNGVRLPPRFTAIWHGDTSALEIIYTVLRVDSDLHERSFEFRFRGRAYKCAFSAASPQLLLIARAADFLGRSAEGARNLRGFQLYANAVARNPESPVAKDRTPTSFWIMGIDDYEEDMVVELVRNLNFFMEYFDKRTPKILVHDESPSSFDQNQGTRYFSGRFPNIVSGSAIEPTLLGLWESASFGDVFLRFIHYYQILEYAAFYHIKDDIMQDIQRVLRNPDAADNPERVARQILDSMVEDRTHDDAKINEVIRRCVDPEEVWHALGDGREALSQDVELEGGFILPAVVSMSEGVEDFKISWNQRFPQALHQIRNRLVHGRESRQSTMVAPTRANRAKLFPWLAPLAFTAARVMLYRNP